jgi:hypothetical protein
MLRVTVALVAVLLLPLRAWAQGAPDEAVDKITQMNKDAITAYQAKKYEDARKILKQALDLASTAGLDNHPITARTHIHLGVVIIVGFGQRDLGIKQFKKALEIQSDINLTKSLVTPDLTDAFAEAKKPGPGPTPPPPVPPPPPEPKEAKTPPPTEGKEPKEAKTPPADEGTGGLVHEAVTEAKQGSAISITVGVPAELVFEKMVLAYRPDGATEFLGREMKQVSDGQYGAEIPTTATSGSVVAYYIEAEDADGGLVASRGSVDSPMEIHLAGVGARHHADTDNDDDDEDEAPDNRYFVGLMAGAGFGWATGDGDTNADIAISPSGLALAGVGQIAPEVGYWFTSSLMFSGQLRYEYITGTTDVYATSPMHTYHTANYAVALFAKATWKYGEGSFHPFFSLAAGGGRIRHVVSFRRQLLPTCGPNHNETCIDTIGAGPVLLGPGAGFMYDITDRAALVVQANSTLGFPTFTVNLDANVGVAFGF